MIVSLYRYELQIKMAANDSGRFYVSELGGFLPIEWRAYVDLARESKVETCQEEYWGVWSAVQRKFSNWPVDSTTHALGRIRDRAQKDLESATIIITTRYSISPVYQPWNLSQNYWFYEQLIDRWDVSFVSPTTLVWKKIESKRASNDVSCCFDRIKKTLSLNIPESGFYEISLQYGFSGRGRLLLLLRNNYNFADDANGYISLDPKAHLLSFPAYFKEPGFESLDFKLIGKSNGTLEVTSCSARNITLQNDQVLRSQ